MGSGKLRRRQFYSQPLENGRVLTQGSTFTYQDVLDQLLVYTPETVSGGVDEMAFTLTDGTFTYTGRLEFTMDVTRSEGPRMTVNRGLQLPAGEEEEEEGGIESEGGLLKVLNPFRHLLKDHRAESEGHRHRLRQPEAQVHSDQRPPLWQTPTQQERRRREDFGQRSRAELHPGRRQQRWGPC